MMKKISIIVFAFFFSFCSAQDLHFTQFYNAPMKLNPGNTGAFKGDLRVISNYSCLLYTSPSPRDVEESRMPSSA